MSTYRADVVRLGPVTPHPNADTLSLTKVFGYECVVRTADFKEGDLAIYFPVDTITNEEPEFAFLGAGKRIKAARLRGVYSEGLVVKARPGMKEGEDAAEVLGVTKYQEPDDDGVASSDSRAARRSRGILGWYLRMRSRLLRSDKRLARPSYFPKFGDPRHLKRHPDEILPGEQVVVTSKIHGANMGVMWDTHAPTGLVAKLGYYIKRLFGKEVGRLLLTSKEVMKDPNGTHWWGRAVRDNGLEEKLRQHLPNVAVYGEVYGLGVQKNFAYDGTDGKLHFRAFALYAQDGWAAPCVFDAMLATTGIDTVPLVYAGPFSKEVVEALAEEDEVAGMRATPNQLREGVVVSRTYYPAAPGAMLKLLSKRYLLLKDATEYK